MDDQLDYTQMVDVLDEQINAILIAMDGVKSELSRLHANVKYLHNMEEL